VKNPHYSPPKGKIIAKFANTQNIFKEIKKISKTLEASFRWK